MAEDSGIAWTAHTHTHSVPSNHRLSERLLVGLVSDGEWSIRPDGTIWRSKVRRGSRWSPGTSHLIDCAPARVEKQMPNGYLMVRAMRGKKRVVGQAHRLVWQHFHGEIPDGKTVNHKNGCKSDNRPENLELMTASEQAIHAHATGLRDQRGQRNPSAKLTDNQVVQIRLSYQQGGFTMEELAGRFNVSTQAVSKIVRGQRRSQQLGPVASRDLRVREFPIIGGNHA